MSGLHYEYDVLVIGAGHAGCEAALAAARMGARTALLTTNCDTVGQMSCNPAIGGVAKGQIVREIDALGGAMGRAIDATGIQFRMLNRRKGPAMHSPRAQADKKAYQQEIKRIVEEQPNLVLRQEVVEDLLVEAERITGVLVRGGAEYRAPAVILTTGTFPASPDAHRRNENARRPRRRRNHRRHQRRACAAADSNWPDSKPARRRGSTAARSTTIAASCSPATSVRSRLAFSPLGSSSRKCPVGSRTPTKRCTS